MTFPSIPEGDEGARTHAHMRGRARVRERSNRPQTLARLCVAAKGEGPLYRIKYLSITLAQISDVVFESFLVLARL